MTRSKTALFVVVLAFLVQGSANAAQPIEGSWAGTGHAKNDQGWDKDCTKIQLQLELTPDAFRIQGGGFACGEIGVTYDPYSIPRVGDDLMHDGKVIGHVSPTSITLRMPSDDGQTWIFEVRVQNGALDYLDRTEKASSFFEVAGHLTTATPR
jgi:hypothetical protein